MVFLYGIANDFKYLIATVKSSYSKSGLKALFEQETSRLAAKQHSLYTWRIPKSAVSCCKLCCVYFS